MFDNRWDSTSTLPDVPNGPVEGVATPSEPGRLEQTLEVAVLLFFVVPGMALAYFATGQSDLNFTLAAYATIFRDLALVCLILFFLWRNREPAARIGWTGRRWVTELLLGLALFLPLRITAALVELALVRLGLTAPRSTPSFLKAASPAQLVLGGFMVVVVALGEETIFRGYLLLRFRNVLRSTPAAVLLSCVIFAMGHGYEGTAGLATVGVMGAFFALVYLWRGSLVAPVVMHFLQDFLGIVLVPLLHWK